MLPSLQLCVLFAFRLQHVCVCVCVCALGSVGLGPIIIHQASNKYLLSADSSGRNAQRDRRSTKVPQFVCSSDILSSSFPQSRLFRRSLLACHLPTTYRRPTANNNKKAIINPRSSRRLPGIPDVRPAVLDAVSLFGRTMQLFIPRIYL